MNKFSLMIKASCLLALVGVGGWYSAPAQAQSTMGCYITGSSPGAIVTTSAMMQGCASEHTVANQFTYLSTGRNQSIGGAIGGAAGVNDGVIELLRKLNDTNSKGIEGDRQTFANDDTAARNRETDLAQRRMIEPYTRPLSAEACREGSVGTGLGGGGSGAGAGGAGANSKDKAKDLGDEFEAETLTPKAEASHLGDLVFSAHSGNYCTLGDGANEMPGCKKGAAGSLPGANLDPNSLLMGARPPKSLRNFSIDFTNKDDQYYALVDYIRMARPMAGPDVVVASKQSPAGKQYLVYQRRYNSRVLAVIHALANIAAQSAKLPENHPFVQNVWNSTEAGNLKQDFKEVYGSRTPVPDRPSERELLRLMVLRQYTTEISSKDMIDSTPEYLGRRQLELAKLNAYLLMKVNEQQEWNNILLAHLLSNDIDPVTRSELMKSASAASATRATK